MVVNVSQYTGGIKQWAQNAECIANKVIQNGRLRIFDIDGEKWISYDIKNPYSNINNAENSSYWNTIHVKKVTKTAIVKYDENGTIISHTLKTPNGKITIIDGIQGFIKNGVAILEENNTTKTLLNKATFFNKEAITRFINCLKC